MVKVSVSFSSMLSYTWNWSALERKFPWLRHFFTGDILTVFFIFMINKFPSVIPLHSAENLSHVARHFICLNLFLNFNTKTGILRLSPPILQCSQYIGNILDIGYCQAILDIGYYLLAKVTNSIAIYFLLAL